MIILTEFLDERCGTCGRQLENMFDQDGNELFHKICDTCDSDKVDRLYKQTEEG